MPSPSRRATLARLLLAAALVGGALAASAGPASAGWAAYPVAVDDVYSTPANTPLVVPNVGVLSNDYDPDGVVFFVSWPVTQPTHGMLALNQGYAPDSGGFTYVPDPGFVGTDTFSYQMHDNVYWSNTAVVTITVGGSAPVAVDDAYSTPAATTVAVAAPGLFGNDTDADGDTLQRSGLTQPANGVVSLADDGSFEYVPDSTFRGDDTFTYTVADGTMSGDSNTATVTITVANADPIAVDDAYSTPSGTELVVDAPGIFGNDSDANGDTIQLVTVGDTSNGVLSPQGDGSFTYVPDAGFSGDDTFTYEITDGAGAFVSATVTITVANADPVAVDDSYSTPWGTELVVDAPGILGNDSDANGEAIQLVTANLTAHGTLTLQGDGSFTYVPDAGFSGDDSFTYEITDGAGAFVSATVTIAVAAAKGAPVSAPTGPTGPVTAGDTVVLNGSGSTTDRPVRSYAWTQVSGPSVTLVDAGTVTARFVPADAGTYVFALTVCDTAGLCDTETIGVEVLGVALTRAAIAPEATPVATARAQQPTLPVTGTSPAAPTGAALALLVLGLGLLSAKRRRLEG